MIVEQKFVCTVGTYREFRGYVFANGNPVTVRDGATAAALAKMPDFRQVLPNEPAESDADKAAPVTTPATATSAMMGAIRKTLRVRDRAL